MFGFDSVAPLHTTAPNASYYGTAAEKQMYRSQALKVMNLQAGLTDQQKVEVRTSPASPIFVSMLLKALKLTRSP
jgi:hypothetical protein